MGYGPLLIYGFNYLEIIQIFQAQSVALIYQRCLLSLSFLNHFLLQRILFAIFLKYFCDMNLVVGASIEFFLDLSYLERLVIYVIGLKK